LHSGDRDLPATDPAGVYAKVSTVYHERPLKDDQPRKGHRADDKGPEEESRSRDSVIPREATKRLPATADGRDDNAGVDCSESDGRDEPVQET
jgi:hypothetical protein